MTTKPRHETIDIRLDLVRAQSVSRSAAAPHRPLPEGFAWPASRPWEAAVGRLLRRGTASMPRKTPAMAVDGSSRSSNASHKAPRSAALAPAKPAPAAEPNLLVRTMSDDGADLFAGNSLA